MFPDLFNLFAGKSDALEKFGLWLGEQWNWIWEWAVGVSGAAAEQLAVLKDILQGIRLDCDEEDRWIWRLDSKKSFTIKSCYTWLVDSVTDGAIRESDDVAAACAKVWKSAVPTNAASVALRLMVNRLPTRDELSKRNVLDSDRDKCCVLCFREEENAEHLFFKCQKMQAVWE